MAKRGRPSKYTPELAKHICDRMAKGESLRRVCRDAEVPNMSTVMRWLERDEGDFREQYAKAREAMIDNMAMETLDIADNLPDDADGARVAAARLQVDTRKWYSSKLAPKKYGDKLDVTSDGEKINHVFNVIIPGDEKDED